MKTIVNGKPSDPAYWVSLVMENPSEELRAHLGITHRPFEEEIVATVRRESPDHRQLEYGGEEAHLLDDICRIVMGSKAQALALGIVGGIADALFEGEFSPDPLPEPRLAGNITRRTIGDDAVFLYWDDGEPHAQIRQHGTSLTWHCAQALCVHTLFCQLIVLGWQQYDERLLQTWVKMVRDAHAPNKAAATV